MQTADAKVHDVRTTVTIDDALYARVKVRAAELGVTVGEVISDAVRLHLAQVEQAKAQELPPLPTLNLGGAMPGIDLDDMSSVLAIQDEGRPLDALR